LFAFVSFVIQEEKETINTKRRGEKGGNGFRMMITAKK